MVEAEYERPGLSQQTIREQAYWSTLLGGVGHFFGNCPLWGLGSSTLSSFCTITDWKTEMDNQGSISMMYYGNLFRSRAWFNLVPDFSNNVLTAGFGTWGGRDYVTTAITSDGNTIISYIPTPRQVTIDMSKISGTGADAWWFNPVDGSTTSIGNFATSGSQNFNPPAAGDWVLVIDDDSLELSIPGQGDYSSPEPAPCTLPYDTGTCNCINAGELADTIAGWFNNEIGISELIVNIKTWKACN